MKEIIISKNDSNQRLDKLLKRVLINASSSFLYKMIRKKNIVLNDAKASGNEILHEGDSIKIYFSDETLNKFMNITNDNSSMNLYEYKNAFHSFSQVEVIYENEHMILLNKPSGILTQKASKADLSLNEWLIGYLLDKGDITENSLSHFKPSVLNRLDRNTSGIVICGKTLIGSRILSSLIKERKIHKFYRLLVLNKMQGSGELKAYLRKDEDKNKVTIFKEVSSDMLENYSEIETHYEVIEASDFASYIEVELITGKTHQIRAHFSYLKHPLLGDYKYGNKKVNDELKKYGIKDQMLHAYRLTFPELTDEFASLSRKEFICSEPSDFTAIRRKFID